MRSSHALAVTAASGRKFHRLGVIVGAMKAGTTSLFSALRMHPQIAASSAKETNFFRTAESAAAGLDAYEALWAYDPARHRIALEASPSYSKCRANPGVPERLAATPYDVRLVYVLRHPIQRYASHYIHALSRGYGPRDVHREIDPDALDASRYASQLAAMTAHIPREKILLVRFEDMTALPQIQLDRVAAHFGVARATWARFPHAHVSASSHLPAAIENLKAESAKPGGRYAPPVLNDDGTIDVARTFLPPAMVRDLRAALADDMRRLREEWGFDVKPWGF